MWGASLKDITFTMIFPMVDEANRSIVEDPLRTLLLGQQDDICEVKPVKIGGVEGVKNSNKPHETPFDDALTMPVKSSGPGALSIGISLMASPTSFSVMVSPRFCKSRASIFSSYQL